MICMGRFNHYLCFMKKIAIIGFGAIGKKLYAQICQENLLEVAFIWDAKAEVPPHIALPHPPTGADFGSVGLVVEAAVPQVVEEYGREIIKRAHFMPLSLTALANQKLFDELISLASLHGHQLYIPHGAILGLEGIFDGHQLFDKIEITTTKNPKSLGRTDSEKTVVFEGSVREAAKVMPRNVNVHAALALAGLGFDQTHSTTISDPSTKENTHVITAANADTTIEIVVKSNPIGAVTGAYTPISAYGSLKRALGISKKNMTIV